MIDGRFVLYWVNTDLNPLRLVMSVKISCIMFLFFLLQNKMEGKFSRTKLRRGIIRIGVVWLVIVADSVIHIDAENNSEVEF
jgi:hypothetical protein